MTDRSRPRPVYRWGLLWQSRNRLDGACRHIVMERESRQPALFLTRQEARNYANERYGYIKTRQDLRREPHGWRMPKPVRLTISIRGAP